jgi:hypothetical protein
VLPRNPQLQNTNTKYTPPPSAFVNTNRTRGTHARKQRNTRKRVEKINRRKTARKEKEKKEKRKI